MFTIKYHATEEYLPVNPSPTVRGHGPIAKAKHHRFAAEEAKAGAFAYDAKRDRAGLTPRNSSKKL